MSELYPSPGAPSLTAATTGTGAAIACNPAKRIEINTVWSTGTSAGEVVYEGAHSASYTGTWKLLATHSLGTNLVEHDDFEKSFVVVRARVTTTVVGGTVTCYIQAHTNN